MLIGDSNTGWTSGQALRVANAVKNIDVFIEQPCPTYRYIMAMVISDVSVENLSMRNSKNISSAPLSLIDINIY